MTLLNDILVWTETLPLWQRDAARRLFQNDGELTDEQYGELYSLLKAEHELAASTPINAIPLAQEHLPIEIDPNETVVLQELKELRNVNRICTRQILSFSKQGITIIYGGNGSGKSGYSRVLKLACRAREQTEPLCILM